jgi:hypothetical protein
MAGFCTNCGAPVTGPFCTGCGTRVGVSSPAAPSPSVQAQQPTAPPPAITPKGSGLAKVLLIVGGILILLFVIAAGSALYGFYWVKHKVASYTSAVNGSSGSMTVVGRGNSCRLLSRAELGKVLGIAIERSAEIMEGSEPGCAYYASPSAFAELQRTAVEAARQQSEEAASKPTGKIDNPLELLKNTNQLEGVVKSLGLSQPDKDGKVFSFTVNRDYGRSNWSALRATMSVVPGFEDLSGVGDRALMGSLGHAIFVLKGDSVITLETTYVPDARNRGAELGRAILSHL